MPIKYILRLARHRIQADPEGRFVFGDNAARVGLGGQAAECRGEPNTIGIATKWRPSMKDDDFFYDYEPKAKITIVKDLHKVIDALKEGRMIYAPMDGVGTGLSQLPKRAPGLYKMIWETFEKIGPPCPWLKPK